MNLKQLTLHAAAVAVLVAPAVVRAEYDPNSPFDPTPSRMQSITMPSSGGTMMPMSQGADSRANAESRQGTTSESLSRAQREGLERKAANTELERKGFTARVP